MTDFHRLWAAYQQIEFASSGMALNGHYLSGLGFFPGGRGLWELNDQTVADKSVMVLGQDFGTETYFLGLKDSEKETLPTWRNLLILLKEANVKPSDCFFTNAFLGLRSGSANMTGKSPAWENLHFVSACQGFFLIQFALQKPRIILVLGENPARFLADLSLGLSAWKRFSSIKSLDEKGLSAYQNVQFKNYPELETSVFLLTHPSYRHLNGLNRKIAFEGQIFEGRTGESDLIKHLIV